MATNILTVKAVVNAPIEKVWAYWTSPEHIVNWNNASDDWHTPKAENDLLPGGRFVFTMAAKDGSMSFDFEGEYQAVVTHQHIAYTIADGRKVTIDFMPNPDGIEIIESFEAEQVHTLEMQVAGWQAILNNFKQYAEQP